MHSLFRRFQRLPTRLCTQLHEGLYPDSFDTHSVFLCSDFEKLRFVPLLDPLSGLRRLTRAQLDKVCSLAECEIVSNKSCEAFDAYVLSESSMFVFPNKFAIKTCGTTKLLQCADHLLACAKTLGLGPCRVKFSRASYKFPESQVSTVAIYYVHIPSTHFFTN